MNAGTVFDDDFLADLEEWFAQVDVGLDRVEAKLDRAIGSLVL